MSAAWSTGSSRPSWPGRSVARSRPRPGSGSGHAPVIAVGRDNRPSGPALAAGVRRGIVEAGGTAIDVGTLPTPALYFGVSALGDRRRAPGDRLPQSSRVQRLQDGPRRRGLSRRRDHRALGDASWRSAGGPARAREIARRVGAAAISGRDSQPAPAGAAGPGGGRLRQRRRQPDRVSRRSRHWAPR